MRFIKQIINAFLSRFGFKITKKESINCVSIEVFKNLTDAYELQINENENAKTPIKPNALRPYLLSRLLGTPPSEAYFLIQALAQTESISGDVCEFGVAQGETSALIANELVSSNGKILHLFDSFEGLPKPTEKDKLLDDILSLGEISAYAGKMKCPEDMVLSRLNAISFPINRFVIHKGFIEKVIYLDKNLPNRVSFAYVDFDFYEPIKIALKFLNSVVSPGSIIVIDDYDFFSTGVKVAVDEFVYQNNLNIRLYDIFIPNHRYGNFAILTRN